MKNILLPTDFSDNSWTAIRYALQLFEKEKCTFYLLNTYMPRMYHADYMPSHEHVDFTGGLQNKSLEALNKLENKILKEFLNEKHTIEKISSLNTLISEMREVVKEKEIDLIVMGTKGATGTLNVLLGTNTMHVINDLRCPTIAVPENHQYSAAKKILFPTEYDELHYEPERLNSLIDLATKHSSEVHMLHVLGRDSIQLTEGQEKNKLRLQKYLKGVELIFHTTEYKDIPAAVNDFLLKIEMDLLVMVNNKKSFFENLFFRPIINKIGFHLKVPFLVVSSRE